MWPSALGMIGDCKIWFYEEECQLSLHYIQK
jgi:hypothetical protein